MLNIVWREIELIIDFDLTSVESYKLFLRVKALPRFKIVGRTAVVPDRVGSTKALHVYIPVTDLERPLIDNVLRKAKLVEEDAKQQEAIFKKCWMEWNK